MTPSLVINEASFVIRVASSGGQGSASSGGQNSASSGGQGSAALDYERLRTVNLTLVAEEVAEDKRQTRVPVLVHIREVTVNISAAIVNISGAMCT